MGHIRYGRLPKTVAFNRIVELLGDERATAKDVSLQTLKAAEEAFDIARNDPSLHYTFWLLTQTTWNSKSEENFIAFLDRMQVPHEKTASAIKFIGEISERAKKDTVELGSNSIFGDMAHMAMREVLTERLIQKTDLLFGSTTEDVRLSLKELSTNKQFGHITMRYFGKLLSRILKFYLNKDISNHVGIGDRFADITSVQAFEAKVDTFSYECAEIVDRFASEWFSKKNYLGGISIEDSKGFMDVALKKLQKDIVLEAKDIAD